MQTKLAFFMRSAVSKWNHTSFDLISLTSICDRLASCWSDAATTANDNAETCKSQQGMTQPETYRHNEKRQKTHI